MKQLNLESVKAFLHATLTVRDCIREAKSIPSGHLYAMVMGHMDLETYNRIVTLLKETGVVTETNHTLTWVDPAQAGAKKRRVKK